MEHTASPLTSREIYQALKELALGMRTLEHTSAITPAGLTVTDSEGWTLTLVTHGDTLDYCETCTSPDGRTGSLDSWHRYGTDPVKLLSHWEHAQVERILMGKR